MTDTPRAAQRARANRRIVNLILAGDGDKRHGTPNGYKNHGCRCDQCTAAWREYHYRWMNADPDRLRRHARRASRRRAGLRPTVAGSDQ